MIPNQDVSCGYESSQKVGSPDFLTELHPKLTDLLGLKYELEQRMKQVNCNDERVVKKWKEQNNVKNGAFNTVPKFMLLQKMKCWGEAPK
eukprot:975718-Ditylum_brightwellii.AAC.1